MIIAISGRKQHGKDTVASLIKENMINYPEHYPKGFGESFRKVQFAAKLKQTASIILNIPIESWEEESFKDSLMPVIWDKEEAYWTSTTQEERKLPDLAQVWGTGKKVDKFEPDLTKMLKRNVQMTYRQFLQKLGTDVCRNIHPNFWINATMGDYKNEAEYYTLSGNSVCTTNYPNWIMPDCRFPNEVSAVEDRTGIVIRIYDPRKSIPKDEHESEYALDSHTFTLYIINDGTLDDLKDKVEHLLYNRVNSLLWESQSK